MGTYSSKDVSDEAGGHSIPIRSERESSVNFPPTYVMVSKSTTPIF